MVEKIEEIFEVTISVQDIEDDFTWGNWVLDDILNHQELGGYTGIYNQLIHPSLIYLLNIGLSDYSPLIGGYLTENTQRELLSYEKEKDLIDYIEAQAILIPNVKREHLVEPLAGLCLQFIRNILLDILECCEDFYEECGIVPMITPGNSIKFYPNRRNPSDIIVSICLVGVVG